MALFKSQVFTQASGSVGGMTYSHNAGGMYVRARAIPVNTNTVYQQDVRTYMATLATAWQTLTNPQRSAWNTYAANVPVVNRLGDLINISGSAMYVRNNVPRLLCGLTAVDAGPTTMSEATLDVVRISITGAGTDVSVSFDDAAAWTSENGSALQVQLSRQQSPTVNYFAGPFRFADSIDGDSTTPPTDPATVAGPFGDVYASGNRVWARVRLLLADGRISAPQITSDIVS